MEATEMRVYKVLAAATWALALAMAIGLVVAATTGCGSDPAAPVSVDGGAASDGGQVAADGATDSREAPDASAAGFPLAVSFPAIYNAGNTVYRGLFFRPKPSCMTEGPSVEADLRSCQANTECIPIAPGYECKGACFEVKPYDPEWYNGLCRPVVTAHVAAEVDILPQVDPYTIGPIEVTVDRLQLTVGQNTVDSPVTVAVLVGDRLLCEVELELGQTGAVDLEADTRRAMADLQAALSDYEAPVSLTVRFATVLPDAAERREGYLEAELAVTATVKEVTQ